MASCMIWIWHVCVTWELVWLLWRNNYQEFLQASCYPTCSQCCKCEFKWKRNAKLTAHLFDKHRLVLPGYKDEVDRDPSGYQPQPQGCLYGGGDHGHHGDEDRGYDVDYWKNQLDLDRPVPLWVLPPQPGDAENCQAYGHLGRRKNIRGCPFCFLN